MDPDALRGLLEELAAMPDRAHQPETANLLEELQKAVAEHYKILEQQGDLIRRLAVELRGVRNERPD